VTMAESDASTATSEMSDAETPPPESPEESPPPENAEENPPSDTADESLPPNSAEENLPPESSETEVLQGQTDANETTPETGETESTDSQPVAETAASQRIVVPVDPAFQAPDRRSALHLLQQVGAYYRRAEPSSPIPVLLEKAESISGKDFFALLREAFPA